MSSDHIYAMTVKEINAIAREDSNPFSERTLRNTLAWLANSGSLKSNGTGKTGSPFRYYRLL